MCKCLNKKKLIMLLVLLAACFSLFITCSFSSTSYGSPVEAQCESNVTLQLIEEPEPIINDNTNSESTQSTKTMDVNHVNIVLLLLLLFIGLNCLIIYKSHLFERDSIKRGF